MAAGNRKTLTAKESVAKGPVVRADRPRMAQKLQQQQQQNQTQNAESVALKQWCQETRAQIEENTALYTACGFKGPRGVYDALKDSGNWPAHPAQAVEKIIVTLIGWGVMVGLLSVGAPFWQDVLASLFGLKNLLNWLQVLKNKLSPVMIGVQAPR